MKVHCSDQGFRVVVPVLVTVTLAEKPVPQSFVVQATWQPADPLGGGVVGVGVMEGLVVGSGPGPSA